MGDFYDRSHNNHPNLQQGITVEDTDQRVFRYHRDQAVPRRQ